MLFTSGYEVSSLIYCIAILKLLTVFVDFGLSSTKAFYEGDRMSATIPRRSSKSLARDNVRNFLTKLHGEGLRPARSCLKFVVIPSRDDVSATVVIRDMAGSIEMATSGLLVHKLFCQNFAETTEMFPPLWDRQALSLLVRKHPGDLSRHMRGSRSS